MHALLFHNPTAGDEGHSRKGLVRAFREAGISVDYCSTKGKDFPAMLEESADLIVAAGGDGTVGKILTKMPDRSIPVMILPLGTANNIARSLGIAGKPKELLAGLKKARKQRFDLGLACGPQVRKLFVEGAGVGSLTEAMARIDSVRIERADGIKLGRDTFRKVLSEAKPIRVELSVDGRKHDEEVLQLEILNIRYAGPGLPLAPEGRAGDGLFDIVRIDPDQRKDMLAWLGASEPNTPPPVTTQQGRSISLSWAGSQLRLDDDYPSPAKRGVSISFEFERDPVTILIPPAQRDTGTKHSDSKRAKAP
jgi:diacylglycerol kinase family enzyme